MSDTVYSTNEEDYTHQEIEDAVEHVWDGDDSIKVGSEFAISAGEAIRSSASDFLRSPIDDMAENAYDQSGEWAEGWPDVTEEQQAELTKSIEALVDAWADKYNAQPTFYSVSSTRDVWVRIINDDGEFEVISEPPQ